MTDRERWTVYPLLFLTLGIAIKDKLVGVVNVDNVQCKSLLCNTLVVTDQERKQQVVIASDSEGGFVRTYGNKNRLQVVLGNTDRLAGLIFIDPEGGVHVNPGSIYAVPPEAQKTHTGEDGVQLRDAHQEEPPESTERDSTP